MSSPEQPGADQDFVFESPERTGISERTFDQYLGRFSMSENDLAGKRILDIGAGFSDFTEVVNQRFTDSGARAVAIDPIYAMFGRHFSDFLDKVDKSPSLWMEFGHGRLPDASELTHEEIAEEYEDFYQQFKEAAKTQGSHIAASHQALPFADNSMDLVVSQNCLSKIKRDSLYLYLAWREMIRVMSENAEARLVPMPSYIRYNNENGNLYLSESAISPEEQNSVKIPHRARRSTLFTNQCKSMVQKYIMYSTKVRAIPMDQF